MKYEIYKSQAGVKIKLDLPVFDKFDDARRVMLALPLNGGWNDMYVLDYAKDETVNTRHKNADVIIAWAEGKAIQHRNTDGTWQDSEDVANRKYDAPWDDISDLDWRVKPEKKKLWIAITDTGATRSGPTAISARSKLQIEVAQYVNIIACIEIEYEEGEGL